MKTAHKTDTGLIRLVNEDRLIVQENLNGFTLAIVADGMGGHQAGDIASQIAIETIQQEMQNVHTGMDGEERERQLVGAVRKANQKVFDLASNQEQYLGMGTTVVAALVTEEMILIAHIGDSRAYLIGNEEVTQLTEDHSLVNELVKSGQIKPEEANSHPRKNVLIRALGTEENVEIDIVQSPWNKGDTLMLCSDGLSNMMDQAALKSVLHTDNSLEWKADRLIEQALKAGGDDNVTVVLLANEQPDQAQGGMSL